MKLTSQFMRKFYQLMAVVLLVLGALFPTVVTYAQEVSNEDSTTTPIVAPANSEESKVEEVTPTPAPDNQEPAVPAQEESSQESSSESGSTKLRSAEVNGVLKMTLNNNTGTDAKYTTSSHVGEVSVDGSGLNDTLEGAFVEIRVPAKYVETMAATAGGIAKEAGVLTQDGENYVLKVALNNIERTTSGSFPFSIKFKDRLTPDGYSVQPRVAVRQADNRVVAGPSSDLTFNVKADTPQLQKLVKANTLDMFVQQDIYGGETDGGDYLNDKASDVPFYFFLSPQGITNQTIQEYRANQTYRSYETIVIKDTLPTYEGVGGQTLTATFDPAKNPGWTNNGDGTVSYTVTNPDPASGGAETTLRNVRLRLSFPNAKFKNGNKQIVHSNNVELTMTPYQKGPSEPDTVLTDDVPFTLTSELVPAGMFRKIANNSGRIRLQPQANHLVEAFWSLAFRNTSALPVSQLVMEDTQLDERMYPYSLTVSGTLNIPLDIYAVAEDGSETYIDTLSRTKRSIENIDSQAWAQVQEQVAKVQSGEIEDTQAVAATRKYKGIRIKLPAGQKHMPTTGFALQYRTRLLDPYNTKALTENKFYNNVATLDIALETEDGSEVKPKQLSANARMMADTLEETVQFNKTTKVNQTGTLGEQVVYRLVFSNFVVSPARAYRNAKFIDILPQGVTFKSATEELAADKGKIKNVEVVENYNGSGRTAVIIDLGTIPAFSDVKPNFPILVEGTINEGAIPTKIQTPTNNEDNHAYFISDEYDPLPDGVKSTTLVDNKFNIQVDGKTPAQLVGATSQTTVNLPSEIASTKYIRKAGESFHTNPVLTDYDEAFDYRLQTRNFSVLPMKHFVLYDRLPYSGDVNTSKFSNLLTGPLNVPAKYTVYYHTAADMTKNAAQEVGRDGWMTADQVADFTQVTAIKIVLNQGQEVEPGEIINFDVPMKAPAYTNGYINREKATNFFSTNRDANDLTSFGDTNAVVNQLPQYIPVAKKWVKEKNLDQVVFELFRKSQPRDVLASMTLNEANGWKGIFKRLDNGQLLDPNVTDYDVREVLPDRYALDYNITSSYDATNPGSDEDERVYEITNERKVRIYYVKKEWEDDNNRLGKRKPIKVQLKQDGQNYRDPLDITEDDNWQISISDVPSVNNGRPYIYSADEVEVPAGYYKEVKSEGNTTVITNKLPIPSGKDVTSEGIQGASQTGTPTYTPGSVTIDGSPVTVDLKPNSYRLVVGGQVIEQTTTPAMKNGQEVGTYTLDQASGKVTFQPKKDFTGQPDPVTVQVEDENGTPATATYTPNVLGVKPSAKDAETTDIQGKEQVGQLTFTPGTTAVDGQDYTVPIAANSLQFLVDGQASTETTIPAKDANGKEIGTYTLNQNGQVTFQPNKDFVGDPVPVQVQAKDENGTPAVATYTPHVTGVKPVGLPATSTGIRGASQSKQVTFQPGHADVPMDDQVPAKLKNDQGQLVESLKVENQGTYTVAADGTVTFLPEKNFVGQAQAVTVVRVDKNGTPAEATYTPTVVDATPTSTNAETTDVQGQVQEGTVSFAPGQAQIDGQAVTVPLVENSLVFVVDGQVVQEKEIDAKDTNGKTIGTYKLNSETGQVTFTPHKDYVGTPVPATIQAHDTNDVTVTATYQPHVTGVTPSGKDVSSSGLQGASQTGQPVFTPGDTKVPITINDEQPAQFFVGGQAVTETSLPAMRNGVEVGTYTLDPKTGQVTFQPKADFVGTPDPATVQVKDANGTPARANYTPTVLPTSRQGLDKVSQDIQGKAQTGQPEFTYNPDPNNGGAAQAIQVSAQNPAKFVVDGAATDASQIDAKDKDGKVIGTYTLTPETGLITFQPNKDFVGTAQPATIQVLDPNGVAVSATYTPTVTPVTPTGTSVTSEGLQGQAQTGTPSFEAGHADVPITINDEQPARLVDPTTGQAVNEKSLPAVKDGKTVGTYTIDPKTGTVTFQPNKDFVGTPDPIQVEVKDANGTPAKASYTPTVTAVLPRGDNQTTTDIQGKTQSATLVFTPGSDKVPMDDTVAATFEDGSTEKKVEGQGTYTVAKDGTVTFVPEKSFVGTADPVTIKRQDVNGTVATATYTPIVTAVTPSGSPATSSGLQGASQTGTPSFTPGHPDVPIKIDADQPAQFVVAGKAVAETSVPATKDGQEVGTYTLDPLTGTVTFQPKKDFVGVPDPVTVQAKDANGTPATATYTPSVTGVTPSGNQVESYGLKGQIQTGKPSFTPGDSQVPIDMDADPTFEDGSKRVTLKGQGSYVLANDGTVTFLPEPEFVGTATSIVVVRVDINGTPAKGTYTPHVLDIVPNHAKSEDVQGKTQSATVGATDQTSGQDLVPSASRPARLVDPFTKEATDAKTVPALDDNGKEIGSYTLDPLTGLVTFQPNKDFVGQPQGAAVVFQHESGLSVIARYQPYVTPNPDSNDSGSSVSEQSADASQPNERGKRPGIHLPKTGESNTSFWLATSLVTLALTLVFFGRKVKAEN